ncbi:hypothetical protein M3221_00410 [Domibacillus indicus]|uniref:hypothetical protein n=1 Tax=Domibacillus indicus TaxID=1437523 RepID=UPI002041B261|nr:hypothetical protein [Domibacillus indicus]MCM3786892.1 hypothetical protein [Domibacillus indicus]
MENNRQAAQRAWVNAHPKVRRDYMENKDNLRIENGRFTTEDGRDLTYLFELQPRVNATTPPQRDSLNAIAELAEHQKEHGGFVFAFFDAAQTMDGQFPTLTQSDLARLMFIGTYAAWETGQLKHDNGRPIDKKGLAELLNVSRPAFGTFYKKLVAEEIIREKDGDLFVNAAVFYRGNLGDVRKQLGDVQYTRLFRKTVRELYELYGGRAIKQLAIIYSVLPFVNFNFNVICYNPEESNVDLVRPMTLDKLAAALGYKDTHKLVTALRKIKHNNQSVFGLFEIDGDKRARKVVVNPSVVYAGGGASLDGIRVLFI